MGIKGLVPCLAMIFVQFCFAGMNIVTKLALDSGMNPLVMVTYRQLFATIALAPFAFLLEWYVNLSSPLYFAPCLLSSEIPREGAVT